MRLKKIVSMLIGISCLAALPVRASLNDCQDVYVGRIWVERGVGLKAVVVLATAEAPGGSYWIFFDNWNADEKKSALAILEGAKIAGHRVHVTTDNVDGCGITVGGTYMKAIFLATNP